MRNSDIWAGKLFISSITAQSCNSLLSTLSADKFYHPPEYQIDYILFLLSMNFSRTGSCPNASQTISQDSIPLSSRFNLCSYYSRYVPKLLKSLQRFLYRSSSYKAGSPCKIGVIFSHVNSMSIRTIIFRLCSKLIESSFSRRLPVRLSVYNYGIWFKIYGRMFQSLNKFKSRRKLLALGKLKFPTLVILQLCSVTSSNSSMFDYRFTTSSIPTSSISFLNALAVST